MVSKPVISSSGTVGWLEHSVYPGICVLNLDMIKYRVQYHHLRWWTLNWISNNSDSAPRFSSCTQWDQESQNQCTNLWSHFLLNTPVVSDSIVTWHQKYILYILYFLIKNRPATDDLQCVSLLVAAVLLGHQSGQQCFQLLRREGVSAVTWTARSFDFW